jgi:hypothetical protein
LPERVAVVPEDAPVQGQVRAVDAVAPVSRLVTGEQDQLGGVEPLDLVDRNLVPAANVVLVDYDADSNLDQLLEQRDPTVRDRLG